MRAVPITHLAAALLFSMAVASGFSSSAAEIRFERLPEGGIQPQAAFSRDHALHVTYFKGDPMGGDIYYLRRLPGQSSFEPPLRVNSQPGSALAAGTMRGPQMSLGANSRVHVAWMGGSGAAKVSVGGASSTPMLYARLSDDGRSFEPERSLLTHAAGLDGGGTVAADQSGNVIVAWHGAPPEIEGEELRGLFLARSKDSGKTFAPEKQAAIPRQGACACCGLKALFDSSGALHILFRIAKASLDRDELWLKSPDLGETFTVLHASPWRTGTCPASSAALSLGPGQSVLGAWETDGKIHAGLSAAGNSAITWSNPSSLKKQKFPSIAQNSRSETLLAWVIDAGWGQPAQIAWQLSRQSQPIGDPGQRDGLPSWSFPASLPTPSGDFLLIY